MKKITLIIALLIFNSHLLEAQSKTIFDTLSYLKSIEKSKSKYIGKKFSNLFDDLKINIKYFNPNADEHFNKLKETSTDFSFFYPSTELEIDKAYPFLSIKWEAPLNTLTSLSLWKGTEGGWNDTIKNYYYNAIIKDFKIIK
jgi:hypothetical protein